MDTLQKLMALIATVAAMLTSPGVAALEVAAHEVFFVGGVYVGPAGKEVMRGAMYVEHVKPEKISHQWPLVLISGTAQTAVNWMTTPDGRKGWAHHFVEQGWEVYLVDQPARGRSAWHPGHNGELRNFSVSTVENLFTTASGDWPQARLHTQWPGAGRKGDPVFDQFYASQVGYVGSNVDTQTDMKAAGVALLDRIGPAVLVTHSQAGPFGWLIADARPALVKAIVALEPQGPPIQSGDRKTAAGGVSDIALTYEPLAQKSSDLLVEHQAVPDGQDLQPCWTQKAPARALVRLTNTPIVVIGAEASYHAAFDHCTVRWLRDAGVKAEFIRLGDVGIHGNGHMMMLELNNLAIADLISTWVGRTIR